MEMRKCKECGKLFMPKGREQYCSDTHYRPCPICGKPVEAKYLSDPARRCEDCKKLPKTRPSSAAPTISVTPDFQPVQNLRFIDDTRRYIGETNRIGFTRGHVYRIDIDRAQYTYEITATYDLTDDKPVNFVGPYSSMISINQNFEAV